MPTCVFANNSKTTVRVELDDGRVLFAASTGPVIDALMAELGDGYPVEIGAYTPPPPTAANIIMERKRRLSLGFDHDFGGERGSHRIGTTESDLIGWREVTDLAGALIASGAPQQPITIVTDTGAVEVTAAEWQSALLAAAAFRQPIWASSFLLQMMEPIPADYADDIWWLGGA